MDSTEKKYRKLSDRGWDIGQDGGLTLSLPEYKIPDQPVYGAEPPPFSEMIVEDGGPQSVVSAGEAPLTDSPIRDFIKSEEEKTKQSADESARVNMSDDFRRKGFRQVSDLMTEYDDTPYIKDFAVGNMSMSNKNAREADFAKMLAQTSAQAGAINGKMASTKPTDEFFGSMAETERGYGKDITQAYAKDQQMLKDYLLGLMNARAMQQSVVGSKGPTVAQEGSMWLNPNTGEWERIGSPKNMTVSPGASIAPSYGDSVQFQQAPNTPNQKPMDVLKDGKVVRGTYDANSPSPSVNPQGEVPQHERERAANSAATGTWSRLPDTYDDATGVPIEKNNKSGETRPERLPPGTSVDLSKTPQGKEAFFAREMVDANKVLEDLEKSGYNPATAASGLRRGVPDILGGNWLRTKNDQSFDTAERKFINAIARPQSGAVIRPDEMENYAKTYFTRSGDSPEVIAQKKRNREMAIRSTIQKAGRAYSASEVSPSTYFDNQSPPGRTQGSGGGSGSSLSPDARAKLIKQIEEAKKARGVK
jgi:hypothetical protein